MSLTKSDLSSIRQVVREETKPQFQRLEKKFDRLFNFLDKEHTNLVKRVQTIENELEISPPKF